MYRNTYYFLFSVAVAASAAASRGNFQDDAFAIISKNNISLTSKKPSSGEGMENVKIVKH